MTNEKNKNLENKIEAEKPSLYDFTRKSIVGAGYRVGASFAIDAVYLSAVAAGSYYASEHMDSLESVTKGFSDFVHNLDLGKLMRVAGFVVGINFIDYKFDITNKLDDLTKKAEKGLSESLGMEKRRTEKLKKQAYQMEKQKYKKLYLELKSEECKMTTLSENVKTISEFEERCNWLVPAKIIYIKTQNSYKGFRSCEFDGDNTIINKFNEGVAKDSGELEYFINKQNSTAEGFLCDESFLDYLYERNSDRKSRLENKFTFKCHRRNSEGKLWINQKHCNGDEEIYFIKKI